MEKVSKMGAEKTENEEGDHRPRNSAQYERVIELLIMHNAKWTPRQISLLQSVSSRKNRKFIAS